MQVMTKAQIRRMRLRFERIAWQALPDVQQVEAIYQQLSARREQESISAWLARAITPFIAEVRPITRLLRLAASDGQLVESTLYSEDECFRLQVWRRAGHIELILEVLGAAIDEYAGQLMGIQLSEQPETRELVWLDASGRGQVTLPDDRQRQRLLLTPGICPEIGLVKPLVPE